MMTSGSTFPRRLTKIDDLTRPDHSYLTAADVCYFLGEYTARKGFAFSATNRLIFNLKKSMDRRGRSEWLCLSIMPSECTDDGGGLATGLM
jgi:hypothetical protein